MNAKDYKYVKPTTDEIVFALVVKLPHWIDRPDDIYPDLPVGAITWIPKSRVSYDSNGFPFLKKGRAVLLESNRHFVNFEPSCFELLHITKQKIKRL